MVLVDVRGLRVGIERGLVTTGVLACLTSNPQQSGAGTRLTKFGQRLVEIVVEVEPFLSRRLVGEKIFVVAAREKDGGVVAVERSTRLSRQRLGEFRDAIPVPLRLGAVQSHRKDGRRLGPLRNGGGKKAIEGGGVATSKGEIETQPDVMGRPIVDGDLVERGLGGVVVASPNVDEGEVTMNGVVAASATEKTSIEIEGFVDAIFVVGERRFDGTGATVGGVENEGAVDRCTNFRQRGSGQSAGGGGENMNVGGEGSRFAVAGICVIGVVYSVVVRGNLVRSRRETPQCTTRGIGSDDTFVVIESASEGVVFSEVEVRQRESVSRETRLVAKGVMTADVFGEMYEQRFRLCLRRAQDEVEESVEGGARVRFTKEFGVVVPCGATIDERTENAHRALGIIDVETRARLRHGAVDGSVQKTIRGVVFLAQHEERGDDDTHDDHDRNQNAAPPMKPATEPREVGRPSTSNASSGEVALEVVTEFVGMSEPDPR